MLKNYTFQLFVDFSHLCMFASICFCRASGLAFLLSLNFLFTQGYYISSRVEIVSTRVEIFHIVAIFFNLVYRVEISTRDENLHIISPLDSYRNRYIDLQIKLIGWFPYGCNTDLEWITVGSNSKKSKVLNFISWNYF